MEPFDSQDPALVPERLIYTAAGSTSRQHDWNRRIDCVTGRWTSVAVGVVSGPTGPTDEGPAINDPQHWEAAWCRSSPWCCLSSSFRPPRELPGPGYTDSGHWRVEQAIYRLIGAQPDNRQRWPKYGFSVLAFSAVSVLFLYGLLLAEREFPNPGDTRG